MKSLRQHLAFALFIGAGALRRLLFAGLSRAARFTGRLIRPPVRAEAGRPAQPAAIRCRADVGSAPRRAQQAASDPRRALRPDWV
jgi:hypothetical protein